MSSPTSLVLATGPWDPAQVVVSWTARQFEPSAEAIRAADTALEELRHRGSPAHDGLAARLADFKVQDGRLTLELQPARWALRLLAEEASGSMAALCVVRDSGGRWLAGRRSAWLASWPGRWALGAGGAVEVDENPAETLSRELEEEWSVTAERLSVEALVRLPNGMAMLVGMAWLPEGAEVQRDEEHDAHAWWPADPAQWPDEAHEPLRRTARMLADA